MNTNEHSLYSQACSFVLICSCIFTFRGAPKHMGDPSESVAQDVIVCSALIGPAINHTGCPRWLPLRTASGVTGAGGVDGS